MTVCGDTEHGRALMGTQTGETPKSHTLNTSMCLKKREKTLLSYIQPSFGKDLNSTPQGFLWSVASRAELSGQVLLEFFPSLPLGVLSSADRGAPWAAWSLHGSTPSSDYHSASSRTLPWLSS